MRSCCTRADLNMVLLEVSDSETGTEADELCLAESWNTGRIRVEMLFPEVLKGLRAENDICVAADLFTPLEPLSPTTFELNAEGAGSPFLYFLTFFRGWTLHGTCFLLGVFSGILEDVAPAWERKVVFGGRQVVRNIFGFGAAPHDQNERGDSGDGRDIGWDFLLALVFVIFGIFLECVIQITPLGWSSYNLGYSLSETIGEVAEAVNRRIEEVEQYCLG